MKKVNESARDTIANLRGRIEGMRLKSHSYMKNNPEKSILIDAGVGAFVGAFLARAMRRKK